MDTFYPISNKQCILSIHLFCGQDKKKHHNVLDFFEYHCDFKRLTLALFFGTAIALS